MHWFKIHHGFGTDAKLGLVAHQLKTPRAIVNAIFLDMLEYASKNDERGSLEGYDIESQAFSLGIDEQTMRDASLSLRDRHLVTRDKIANWERYQSPVDPTHAARQKRYRDKQKQQLNNSVTVSDASRDTDKIRIEKKEKKEVVKETTSKESRFEEFWVAFPKQRKGGKQNAIRAYASAIKRATEDEIINKTKIYSESSDVARGFAKGAAAWLNDDQWTTDYTGVENAKRNHSQTGVFGKTKTERENEAVARAVARSRESSGQSPASAATGSNASSNIPSLEDLREGAGAPGGHNRDI